MCGRFTQTLEWAGLQQLLDLPGLENFVPRHNVAPGQKVRIVRAADAPGGAIAALDWGWHPADAETGSPRPINARVETVASKPLFRQALRSRRCLVPADGFLEWERRAGGEKRPVWFRLEPARWFAMASLWTPSAEGPGSFTILTTTPNELVGAVHDRMPVILPRPAYRAWLDPAHPDPLGLLRPLPAGQMTRTEVDPRLGSPREDHPDLLRPWKPAQTSLFDA
jgi:putative SOS response-associated peptidase YedK